jgi:hypothetical protein
VRHSKREGRTHPSSTFAVDRVKTRSLATKKASGFALVDLEWGYVSRTRIDKETADIASVPLVTQRGARVQNYFPLSQVMEKTQMTL